LATSCISSTSWTVAAMGRMATRRVLMAAVFRCERYCLGLRSWLCLEWDKW
jgi:hypothetical protein